MNICLRILGAFVLLGSSSRAGDIAGRVLDANGAPVADARVLAAENTVARIFYSTPKGAFATSASEADPELGTDGHLTGEARTDADGKFAIHELRKARYTLFAIDEKRGFATRLDCATDAKPLDLTLAPGATIEGEFKGFVHDATKHVLQLKPRAPTANITFSPDVEYTKDGHFSFGPLPQVDGWNVSLTEWVMDRAFSSTLITVPVQTKSGTTARVVLDFAAGEALSGFVRGAHGEPLANVAVVAHKQIVDGNERGAVTDEEGRFTLRGLERGAWTLEARRWTMRASIGCGVGPKDVFVIRRLNVPLASGESCDLQATRAPSTPQLGDIAPNFEVNTLDGRVVSMLDLRGKIVLVDFWATWCGMCRAEFPRLRETYALSGGGKRFEIVGVNVDDDVEAARRVVASLKLAWPQTALGPVESNALAQLFNIASTPSSFLIDGSGKIVGVNLTGEDLRREIAKISPRK